MAVVAVVLLVPLTWVMVSAILVDAPSDVEQTIFYGEASARCVERNPCPMSLEKLLQNPITFDQSFVKVTGILRIEFESDRLYINQNEYQARDNSKSVWINLTQVQRNYAPTNGSKADIVGKVRNIPIDIDTEAGEHIRIFEPTINVTKISTGGS